MGAVVERGREIVNASFGPRRGRSPSTLAHRLLEVRGEASALAVAADLVEALERMDAEQLEGFLELLATDFSPDPGHLSEAVELWRRRPADVDALLALMAAVEPPRQELFRRLNTAPGGTPAILRLRRRLLQLLPERPQLRAVEADLRHLLGSWFNRGFLRLEAIDWQTPAATLEKLIAYEAVHEIRGWEDLRRRLAADRRCFAFFHPALPGEPLIFVEVALTRDLPDAIEPLIDPARPVSDPQAADTAVFFSISNCQEGLRGISFGSFLIKQVVAELEAELPWLKRFVTLSPLPLFAESLRRRDLPGGFTEARLRSLAAEFAPELRRRTGLDDPLQGLEKVLAEPALQEEGARRLVERLALAYLVELRREGRVLDPVAHFHLSNGARLERINARADLSPRGLRESHGVMVNYLYERERLEVNHERYVGEGEVTMSRQLAAEHGRLRAVWRAAA